MAAIIGIEGKKSRVSGTPIRLLRRFEHWTDSALTEYVEWPQGEKDGFLSSFLAFCHLRDAANSKRSYFLIDPFSPDTAEDVPFEPMETYVFTRPDGEYYAGIFWDNPERLEAMPQAFGQETVFLEYDEVELIGRAHMVVTYLRTPPRPAELADMENSVDIV